MYMHVCLHVCWRPNTAKWMNRKGDPEKMEEPNLANVVMGIAKVCIEKKYARYSRHTAAIRQP